jgi:putative phosphoesterase
MIKIGLISDTHNRVDPLLPRLFKHVSFIIHAGDICKPSVLRDLEAIAPVYAVRGNNDHDLALMDLPEFRIVEVNGIRILVTHDAKDPRMPEWFAETSPFLVVVGHTHRPGLSRDGAVYRVNPGSAGPRRFKLPRTAGILLLDGKQSPEIQFWDLAEDQPFRVEAE